MTLIEYIGLAASIGLPLWNIPLILRIIKRRSSADLSMTWVMGVWVCSLLIVPSGFMSKDIIWRSFSIVNLVLFTGVVIVAFKYRQGGHGKE
ncbi:MAG: hypothetical protein HYZ86_04335 [Candidatus Omnitrophica bacterium]|nr:hypothetical protein [Candidatus Omnitrophota bacterium]